MKDSLSENSHIIATRGDLPHWSLKEYPTFVTFRLDDSLPQMVTETINGEFETFCRQHPKLSNEEARRMFASVRHKREEEFLNRGLGLCVLRSSDAREIVVQSLHYGDGKMYRLLSYVVMPNHVHLLLIVSDRQMLQKALGAVKQYTARRINALLGQSGHLWQRESFDRLIRSAEHYYYAIDYIRNNPRGFTSDMFSYWKVNPLPEWNTLMKNAIAAFHGLPSEAHGGQPSKAEP